MWIKDCFCKNLNLPILRFINKIQRISIVMKNYTLFETNFQDKNRCSHKYGGWTWQGRPLRAKKKISKQCTSFEEKLHSAEIIKIINPFLQIFSFTGFKNYKEMKKKLHTHEKLDLISDFSMLKITVQTYLDDLLYPVEVSKP